MFEDRKARLEGCIYTIFTPFDADEEVDYDSLRSYLRHLYDGGARCFYAMAYNSRYSQMTDAEIMALNAFCIKEVKALDPDNIVVVGDPIHCSTKVSADFARQAAEEGADFISLIMREKYFSDEQVLDHYAEIGRAANIALLVHEMPFLSGADGSQMQWPMSLLRRLREVPQIAALKEDAKTFDIIKVALELEPDIRVVLAGRKSAFLPFYKMGARAYLNGISIIDARIGEIFWKALEGGRQPVVDYVLNELEAPFFDECAAKYGWHRTNKALLEAAGLMPRRDRMPLKHLSDEQFKDVQAVHDRIAAALPGLFEL